MKEKHDQLLDHDYDGIQEYDNPLPKWWLWLFYATILFAPLYLGYYHVLGGPDMIESYEQEVSRVEDARAQSMAASSASQKVPGAPASEGDAAPAAAIVPNADSGKAVFMSYCASCHGQQGEGGIGPNLADAYWIHGNTTENIVQVITQGVAAKGMVAWNGILNPQKIQDVTAFIQTLQGTNPPNAKAPQGEKYE